VLIFIVDDDPLIFSLFANRNKQPSKELKMRDFIIPLRLTCQDFSVGLVKPEELQEQQHPHV
jgi:hypothetical protein